MNTIRNVLERDTWFRNQDPNRATLEPAEFTLAHDLFTPIIHAVSLHKSCLSLYEQGGILSSNHRGCSPLGSDS
jgi:hypothetical protein